MTISSSSDEESTKQGNDPSQPDNYAWEKDFNQAWDRKEAEQPDGKQYTRPGSSSRNECERQHQQQDDDLNTHIDGYRVPDKCRIEKMSVGRGPNARNEASGCGNGQGKKHQISSLHRFRSSEFSPPEI
jgi:hypothetical protein